MIRIKHKLLKSSLAILALAMLGGCESNQQRQAKEQRQATQMKNSDQDESLPNENYFDQDNQHKSFIFQQKHNLESIAQQMNQNYHKLGSTTYDSSANHIILNLHGKQSEQVLKYLKANNTSAEKFWNQLTKGFKKNSAEISKQAKDKSLVFDINNLDNKSVFAVRNGKVLKNAFK